MQDTKVSTNFKKPKPTYFFRQWRKKRGYTQEELAALIGVSTPTISQLETGKQGFTGDTLSALAEALQVAPWELLTRNPFADSSLWVVLEQMGKADETTRDQIARVVTEMVRSTKKQETVASSAADTLLAAFGQSAIDAMSVDDLEQAIGIVSEMIREQPQAEITKLKIAAALAEAHDRKQKAS